MEIERLKSIVLYVLHSVPGKCLGKHELFKILYFASQKRLVRYGYAMISDFYAFKYGPVPSELYDYLKGGNNAIMSSVNLDEESKSILSPIEEPDMEELSKVDIECLDESINENSGLSFYVLTTKSHDLAWYNAWHNTVGKRGGKMDIIDIAKAVNADDRTIEYIQEELELESALR
jgi:uncharacterized phage-associated protein